jgi:hypothetical protein
MVSTRVSPKSSVSPATNERRSGMSPTPFRGSTSQVPPVAKIGIRQRRARTPTPRTWSRWSWLTRTAVSSRASRSWTAIRSKAFFPVRPQSINSFASAVST